MECVSHPAKIQNQLTTNLYHVSSFTRETFEDVDNQRLARIRHHLAEEVENAAHAATIGVTMAKLATGNPQLEAAEIAIATTTLAISFFHAAHHKYQKQQELKQHVPSA